MERQYGEKEIRELGEHYRVGDSPPINCEELLTEWFDLRVYIILYCCSKSTCLKCFLFWRSQAVTYLWHILTPISLLRLAYYCLSLQQIVREGSPLCVKLSRLRSEISNSTLNHCMHISIEGPRMEEFDFNTSLDKWSSLKNRRIV